MKREELAEIDPKILTADGFDEALIGYVDGWVPAEGGGVTQGTRALYDRTKCIAVLMKRDGMTEEEAEEFFEYNVIGAYMGPMTPMFASLS